MFDLKLRANFQNPRTTPSGRKVCGTEKKERKKEKKNDTKYSAHFVPKQRPRAALALPSDQLITQKKALVSADNNVSARVI